MFRLPGEAMQIDRVMDAFAAHYCAQNPFIFQGMWDPTHFYTSLSLKVTWLFVVKQSFCNMCNSVEIRIWFGIRIFFCRIRIPTLIIYTVFDN
jgi:hypothetical protein